MMDEAREKETFDVFLSHNSKDKPAVRALAALLAEHGVKVWFDEDQLIPGRPWQPLLERGIKESATGAVLVGDDGVGPWEDEEMQALLGLAVRAKKPVIPVLLPGAPQQPGLPAFLANRTWVDLREGFRGEQLVKLIWGITGKKPDSTSATAAHGLKIAVTRLRHGADNLVGREKELARLDTAWHDPKTHVVTIVAWGGVGKTALVVEWMARMAQDGWRGARHVFDWSFYSQGTGETTTASADVFIAKALEFFGDPQMAQSPASPWDKGERLARLVAERKTLLVLDGVEPLQYPPGPVGGKLKDPALEALLKGLAQHVVGLCLVTTREALTDLAPFRNTTAPEWSLEHLSEEAGAQLLFDAGVRRAGDARIEAGDPELKDATREVGGHALTLRLLGNHLRLAHSGDIRRRDVIAFEEAEAEFKTNPGDAYKSYGHAFKVMAACERWLATGGEEGRRQLAVLHLLGLFDRPADAGCLAALRREPAIGGLTEPLVGLSEGQWHTTVSRLQECGMISSHADDASPATFLLSLDAHPLVREYFGKQLREKQAEAWRMSHSRLYQHLCSLPEKEFPDTLEEMEPLYQAVQHGCQAGCFHEALADVFRNRLRRGHEHYSFRCGLAGADLAALGGFFERHWSRVVSAASAPDQAYILNEAGSMLRALGRISEAQEPVRASLGILTGIRDWKAAANTCTTLVNVLLLRGDIARARGAAEQGVGFADQSADVFFRVSTRITLARVLNHLGENHAALGHIQGAGELEPEMRSLRRYALQAATICDILVDTNQSDEAEERAKQMLQLLASAGGYARETAVHHIGLGRIYLERAHKGESRYLPVAGTHLRRGVEETRKANRQDELPAALISLASLQFMEGDQEGAEGRLNEAWQIAERGSMRLLIADVLLHRARLFRDKKALAEARELIEKCGYHRRDGELADAEEAAKGW